MTFTTTTQRRSILLFIGVSIICVISCSPKINFERSAIVPAAAGSVKVKKDGNNNYSLTVKILHLADPQRLSPPRKTYIVWMETEQHNTKNIGQFQSSTSVFSNTLKGTLNALTAFKPLRIYITAEDDGTVSYPLGQTVLTTKAF